MVRGVIAGERRRRRVGRRGRTVVQEEGRSLLVLVERPGMSRVENGSGG